MAPTRTPVEQDKPQQVAQRLKLVDPETASKPIADALALLPLINVFRAMANAETLYPYFGKYMLQVVGHSVGVTDRQIAALETGDIKANCFSEAERIAFSFTNEVMDLIEATDATYAAVKKNFSDRAITEMLYVIGTYMLVVRVLRTGRVPLDDKPADSPQ